MGWRHFNGGIEGWDEAFRIKIDSKLRLFDINHPRGFNQYVYNARGGYVEIGIPLRVLGKWSYEMVELASQRIIGKLESPPESVVTEADKQSFYTMAENIDKGSYIIGFTQIRMSKSCTYYDKPLVKGVLVKTDTPVPDGLSEFILEGGRYVKITEDVPNGELGWELGEMLDGVERETGYAIDTSRQYIYKQCNFGRSFELYVPSISK